MSKQFATVLVKNDKPFFALHNNNNTNGKKDDTFLFKFVQTVTKGAGIGYIEYSIENKATKCLPQNSNFQTWGNCDLETRKEDPGS
eukprot:Pgem_evm1s13444